MVGQVPRHWDTVRLGTMGQFLKGSGGSKDDEVPEGVPCVRYGDLYTQYDNFIRQTRSCVTPERAMEYTPIVRGDVLFAASGETIVEIGKSAVVLMNQPAVAGGDVIIFRPSAAIVPSFMGYATGSPSAIDQKARNGRGVTVMHIYPNALKHLWLPMPPHDEQAAIVRFVDHADRLIRRYIAAKQKLIALIEEQRQTLVQQAITIGLDSDAPMKPTALKWLKGLPSHWDVVPLRHLLSFGPKNGVSPPPADSGGVMSLSISAVRGGRIVVQGNEKYVALAPALVPSLTIESGDILLVRGNGNLKLVAKCGQVADMPQECIYPDLLMRLRTNSRMLPSFMVAAINSPYVGNQIPALAKTASGIFKVSNASVRSLLLAVPPIDEQRDIMNHVEATTRKLDLVRTRAHEQVALLRDFRSRLVADVVTGKLDVREAAASLPETNETSGSMDDYGDAVEADEDGLEALADEVVA